MLSSAEVRKASISCGAVFEAYCSSMRRPRGPSITADIVVGEENEVSSGVGVPVSEGSIAFDAVADEEAV